MAPNSLLEAALAYAKRGWPVFPCRADKRPHTENGFYDASTEPAQLEAWWAKWPRAGIGFEPGSVGLMALDFDAYKEGFNWTAATQAIGGLPETGLIQFSPRGGEHHLFKLDKGEHCASSASKIGGCVDVRGMGGYILLAPSRTADGEYSWKSYREPAHRSDEMLRLANTARSKSTDRDNWLIEPDLPENVDAAIAWLKDKAKPAIEGQGGDHCAYATAAMMKSYGVSEPLAFELMWEHWNPRCDPPWSADEFEHLEAKVRNGYSYNTSPPGNVTEAFRIASAARLFQPVTREVVNGGIEGSAGRFRFVDRDGMEAIKPPSWLLGDFLPLGGHCLLFGAHGTFKTFVALDIALTVASGFGPIWGAEVSGSVLYAAGEGRSALRQRVQAWEKLHYGGARVPNFVLADPVPHVDEPLEAFINGARGMAPDGYKLIVLDTVGRSMQGLNENAQEHASKYTRTVEALQREFGATVLGLAHTGHDKGSAERARGSSVFGADADTLVRLDRQDKAHVVSLTMTKQKDAAEWEAPRHVKLTEVDVGAPKPSLACTAATPEEATAGAAARRPEPGMRKRTVDTNEPALMVALGDAVRESLRAFKPKEWTGRALAAHLVSKCQDRVQGSEETTRRRLRLLYAAEAHARYYDSVKQVWKWVD